MIIKMVYRDGKKYEIKYYEISDEEANDWIKNDFEQRLNDAPEEEKKNIMKRTPQEIADDFNRQEERFNKDYMRKRAKTNKGTITDEEGNEVERLALIPDKETSSSLEMCLQEESRQEIPDAKKLLYSKLTETQKRRFEMKINGMTISEIAEIEGVKFNSVKESLDQVEVKIKKIISKNPLKKHSKMSIIV